MRLFLTLLLCCPVVAIAHGDAHDRIRRIDQRIAATPQDAELLVQRGRIHLEEHHVGDARADFERALALNPVLHAARYHLAEALFHGGAWADAEAELLRYLAAQPAAQKNALARGHWLLGDVCQAHGRPADAVAAYDIALGQTAEPTPEQYRAYTHASLAAGGAQLDVALARLERVMGASGATDALIEMALEVELRAGRVDAGVARIDGWIARGRRLAFLHFRKAEILAGAGRAGEARQSLAAARAAFAELPPQRRKLKAFAELAQKMEALEGRIEPPARLL